MYCKNNPPKPLTHMAPAQYTRQLYDFGRDKDHNVIVVKGEKVNFDKISAAAAEGCDFRMIKETLRAGSVRLPKEVFENTPGKGAEYGVEDRPTSLIEVADVSKKARVSKHDAQQLLDGMPEDLHNGMTLEQFSKFVDEGYLDKYLKLQESKKKLNGGDNNAE